MNSVFRDLRVAHMSGHKTAEGCLFHYTSLAGLVGISGSQSMFATHLSHLNDSSELEYGISILLDIIRTRLREKEIYSEERICLVQLEEWLGYRFLNSQFVFACSFSTKGNLLSQWRAYCPPSNGISLGFYREQLQQSAETQGFKLVQCIYDRETQKLLLAEWLRRLLATRTLSTHATSSQSYHPYFFSNDESLIQLAGKLKSPAFEEEQEWRVISPVVRTHTDPRLRFRVGKTKLIPYIEFKLPLTPSGGMQLQLVVLGPSEDHNLSFAAASAFMSNQGIQYESMHASGIPLRAP